MSGKHAYIIEKQTKKIPFGCFEREERNACLAFTAVLQTQYIVV